MRRVTRVLVSVLALVPSAAIAQEVAAPVLRGQAFAGRGLLTSGTAVLHHLSVQGEGEVDSTSISSLGTFEFRLPNVPDPAREDVFFASIRHHGVLYFGIPVTQAVQLDSVYRIQTYDTVSAPPEGLELPVNVRNVFIEPDSGRWRVTDLFQLLNPEDHTIVTREPGFVWRYPLPDGATDFTLGHGEISPDATTYENGHVVLRAPIPPGERLVLVRYKLDSPFMTVPTPGTTERFELLLREPAPLVDVTGLTFVERAELEPGTTYLRYSAAEYALPGVRLTAAEEPFEPNLAWAALLVAMLLAGIGVVTLRNVDVSAPASSPSELSRHDLLVMVAQLDEAFEANEAPTDAERAQYRRRRGELLARLRRHG